MSYAHLVWVLTVSFIVAIRPSTSKASTSTPPSGGGTASTSASASGGAGTGTPSKRVTPATPQPRVSVTGPSGGTLLFGTSGTQSHRVLVCGVNIRYVYHCFTHSFSLILQLCSYPSFVADAGISDSLTEMNRSLLAPGARSLNERRMTR